MCLKRRASLFFIISLFAFAIVLMMGISLGTEYWVEAGVQRDLRALDSSNPQLNQLPLKSFLGANPIDGSDPGAFLGIVRFGLFSGCKRFNYGLGVRDPTCFSVFKEHEDVYNLKIVITVIVFILGAIVFGLVATVFGLVNTLTVPIETIHGPVGLYVWNGIGAICAFIAWILYLSLYHTDIKHNVLNKVDSSTPYFFQTDRVEFGYSYWLLIAGFILFLLNIFFVFLAQCVQDPKFLWRKNKENTSDSNRNDVGLGLMY
ncbi:clarin-1-like isoform X2 [Amphiura filiformis]|uniref:clarin-1-like isoform X2 n=1 Tax=Amphiura filiformis TaxID=82378 RepID=UPI003B214403